MQNEIPPLVLTDEVRGSWREWLAVTKDRCHLNFELASDSLSSHIDAGFKSGLATARRVRDDISDLKVHRVLEVGCSVGFNCLGLAVVFPDAQIFGIEPDSEAVKVGKAMSNGAGLKNITFQKGLGELLPFDPDFFDLIVCHTVIEHVNDVPKVIAQMGRVLAPAGYLHLEAPNYVWPYEPHLGIWCLPLLGKKFVRFLARLQGKKSQIYYLEHLKFVHPKYLESLFSSNNFSWDNRAEKKLKNVLSGRHDLVFSYHRAANLLSILKAIGIGRLIEKYLLLLKLYPSVLYTISKRTR
ncbi:class I SAM-dependent methyltransferase [Propionivibrio sp.]|uniref:class I SAM-dependent methyltransferase n=1 Tax=Propionivibrio sp. TaxID=2212460 RepID=UPI002620FDA3|nr:class I SAM-dependent methyltransferase [Propionivibrio sp.]